MLRARLTLLYSTLLGGVLLLFGMAVYALVNVTLIGQIDDLLDLILFLAAGSRDKCDDQQK